MSMEIDKLVKAALEAKIIEAFKTTPEAIDALVEACLKQPVNEYGGKPDYNSSMPYLTYLARDTIQSVAREAVREHVSSIKDEIKDSIKRKLSSDAVVDAFTNAVLSGTSDEWAVEITFSKAKV